MNTINTRDSDITWEKCGYHVIEELGRISHCTNKIKFDMTKIRADDIPKLRDEISALKVKAGIWGLIAGAIPSLAALIIFWLKNQ